MEGSPRGCSKTRKLQITLSPGRPQDEHGINDFDENADLAESAGSAMPMKQECPARSEVPTEGCS
jgi:hypothetical protein